jgi:hypothetical protein
MSRLARLVLPLAAMMSIPLFAQAGDVKEADRSCRTATAILLTGDGADDASRWNMIREVLATNSEWKVVTDPPVDRVGEVALRRFDIKHTFKGGPTVAYTVVCGHGGTCNDVAVKFREKFPTMTPVPVVQCGDVGNMLTNPQAP